MPEHRERPPEAVQETPEALAESISNFERIRRVESILRDREVRAGFTALLRTGVNTGISIADFPLTGMGVGEFASWGADACKIIGRQFNIKLLDTTPDVARWIAVGTEAGEVALGAPTHLAESLLQFKADKPRMTRAITITIARWEGELERRKGDAKLTDAVAWFLNK